MHKAKSQLLEDIDVFDYYVCTILDVGYVMPVGF